MKVIYDKGMREEAKKDKEGLLTIQIKLSNGQATTLQGVYPDKILNKLMKKTYKTLRRTSNGNQKGS